LLRHGVIHHHGVFVNLESGVMQSLAVDAKAWRRFRRAG
jgi:hypothetical protein